jgi:hypothetical protein
MRPTLLIPALLVFTVPVGAQSWQEYSYPDYSFRISFPADPQSETTAYRVTDDRTVEAHVYAVRSDNAEFKMTVADLANTGLDENAVIDHAVKALSEGGEVKVNTITTERRPDRRATDPFFPARRPARPPPTLTGLSEI